MFNMRKGTAPYHIFLIGKRQVGKSTLVSKVLSQTDIKYSMQKSIDTLIESKTGAHLVVIDDIENLSNIISLIERTDICILGVIQDTADVNLVSCIKNNPNVKTFVVKESNRDRLVPVVKRLLNFDII